MTLKLLLVCAVLGTLVVQGVLRRRKQSSASEWSPYAARFLLSAAMVAVSGSMAVGVDHGVTHGWAFALRLGYVGVMMLLGLYGIVTAVVTLRAFAGDEPPPSVVNGYLLTFTAFIILLLVAMALDKQLSIPFDRTGAALLGAFALFLAIRPPEFLRGHAVYATLADIIGESPLRLIYAAIGVAFIYAALTGATTGLFRR